jgi:hypothetical protein
MSYENEDDLTPAERELEAALRLLRPAPAALDPLVIAYRAGARTRTTSLWAWRAVAAVLAVGLGAAVLNDSGRDVGGTSSGTVMVERPAPRSRAASPTFITMQPQNAPSQWRLRERVLDQGLDALAVPIWSPPAQGQPVPRAGDTTWRPL